jgi:hypothetical protein
VLQDGEQVVPHRLDAEVARDRGPAPTVRAQVEQDASVPLREVPPLVVPRREIEAEAVHEHERRVAGIAGGAHGDRRAVERSRGAEVLGRQRGQLLVRLGVRAPRAQDHAAGDPAGHRERRHARRDDRSPAPAHPTCSRGTRSEIAVTIS